MAGTIFIKIYKFLLYVLLITVLILAHVCRRATPVKIYSFSILKLGIFHCNYRYYALLTTQESIQTLVNTGVHTAKTDVHAGKNTSEK